MPAPSGLLVLAKPVGPTSHDAVAAVRRALGTKRVGHAGTLDPNASGVLVVLVGEATKLAPFVAGHDKRYIAEVAFGTSTDSFDAVGQVVASAPVPPALVAELAGPARPTVDAALEAERARTEQVPPAHSAIHLAGKRAYELARAGRAVELAPRPVTVRSLEIVAASPTSVTLEAHVGKGYYVRSLARDLGERLGVPAHLRSLKRTASGPFTLADAVVLGSPPEALLAAIVPLAGAAARALPVARLGEGGAVLARTGRALAVTDFVEPPPEGTSAWFDPAGQLVAVGDREGDRFAVRRGFVS